MTTLKRLIVNADDFGRTAGINRGIIAAHERGIVTSATLMVNYAPAAEAAALARQNAGIGVGLHVALTGGPPALPPEQIRTLVDVQGRFPPKPDGLRDANPMEVLAGGVFKACPSLPARIERCLGLAGAQLTPLRVEPAQGAVSLALDLLRS